MILIAWISISLFLIAVGITIVQPRWLLKAIQRKYYCERCHKYIGEQEMFLLKLKAEESREERQV